MSAATTHVCRRCTIDKPLDAFPIDGRSGRHQLVCRACRNAANRQRRAADRVYQGPTDIEAEVARLRTAVFDLRARLAALRSCTDPRCSLCTACLAAMELHDREGLPS
jgi:hypothetical protein